MKRPSPGNPTKRHGFTLLEILVAMFILVVILSTVYASFTGSLRIVDVTESQAEIYQMARIALERLTEDLEAAYIPQEIASPAGPDELGDTEKPTGFEGVDDELAGRSADTMRFFSRAHLVFGDQDLPCETAEISYFVGEDDEGETFTLYRRDRLQVEEEAEESDRGLPLCEALVSVGFQYYDDKGEEYDTWDSAEKGFPTMVSLSLEFVNPSDPETPLHFATSVALPKREV
ncbi:MAG: prepilin-type N-terminal cleavage/methylation domain-containing protein [Thermodesulfobacteriota bacterium]|nr:prepilin-type N-terminal cleavage/methylation domain-containing protein [Thermodesulfobacteriota bacterium]